MAARGADSPGLVAEAGQLGTDLLGAGMTQVVEDGERLPQGLAGARQLAGRLAGITEVADSSMECRTWAPAGPYSPTRE
jgi:hypothetical protein